MSSTSTGSLIALVLLLGGTLAKTTTVPLSGTSLSYTSGPVLYGQSWTWSKVNSFTTVATVHVMINKANGKTSYSTSYHVGHTDNGEAKKSNVDSKGTRTSEISGHAITYPTNFFQPEKDFKWAAVLPVSTNGGFDRLPSDESPYIRIRGSVVGLTSKATCCLLSYIASPTPVSHQVFPHITQEPDPSDPRGLLYALVGAQPADPPEVVLTADELSKLWQPHSLTVAYGACMHSYCLTMVSQAPEQTIVPQAGIAVTTTATITNYFDDSASSPISTPHTTSKDNMSTAGPDTTPLSKSQTQPQPAAPTIPKTITTDPPKTASITAPKGATTELPKASNDEPRASDPGDTDHTSDSGGQTPMVSAEHVTVSAASAVVQESMAMGLTIGTLDILTMPNPVSSNTPTTPLIAPSLGPDLSTAARASSTPAAPETESGDRSDGNSQHATGPSNVVSISSNSGLMNANGGVTDTSSQWGLVVQTNLPHMRLVTSTMSFSGLVIEQVMTPMYAIMGHTLTPGSAITIGLVNAKTVLSLATSGTEVYLAMSMSSMSATSPTSSTVSGVTPTSSQSTTSTLQIGNLITQGLSGAGNPITSSESVQFVTKSAGRSARGYDRAAVYVLVEFGCLAMALTYITLL